MADVKHSTLHSSKSNLHRNFADMIDLSPAIGTSTTVQQYLNELTTSLGKIVTGVTPVPSTTKYLKKISGTDGQTIGTSTSLSNMTKVLQTTTSESGIYTFTGLIYIGLDLYAPSSDPDAEIAAYDHFFMCVNGSCVHALPMALYQVNTTKWESMIHFNFMLDVPSGASIDIRAGNIFGVPYKIRNFTASSVVHGTTYGLLYKH